MPTDDDEMEMWRELKEEIESWPRPEGGYKIQFNGDPEPYEETFTCPNCHRVIHAHGVSFGPHKPGLELSSHQSFDCPAWINRWWRFTHVFVPRTLYNLGLLKEPWW